jgi:hypothetical protein
MQVREEVGVVDDRGRRSPQPGGRPEDHDLESALVRLEDLLLGLPFDRALPDVEALLAAADVPADVLRRDERALKLLHEAVVARPFGSLDAVQRVRTEVGLLTLEVELLTDRLADRRTPREIVERSEARLAQVRARLETIRGEL